MKALRLCYIQDHYMVKTLLKDLRFYTNWFIVTNVKFHTCGRIPVAPGENADWQKDGVKLFDALAVWWRLKDGTKADKCSDFQFKDGNIARK